MTHVCGWFTLTPSDHHGEKLQAAVNAVAGAGPTSVLAAPLAALAARAGARTPLVAERDGQLLVIDGHARLAEGTRFSTDPHSLLQALRTEGRTALTRIEGDFVLLAWNRDTRRGLVAVDRIGMRRLVYQRQPDRLAFASSLDLLGAMPEVEWRVSRQALFDYVFQHVTPGPQTVCEGLHLLPAGHCIEFGPDGAGQPAPYWSMQFDETDRRDVATLKDEFLAIVRASVARAAEGGEVGSFLSGGTDSSTVSGMLCAVGGKPARSFSIGFDAAGYDEMEYARIAAKHYGCEHHEYYVTPKDVVAAVPLIAATYDQPFGNASAVPTYYCAKLAREHGITRLLAGDGGDELFGGNERYAKHHLLGLYQRVPAPLRRYVAEPLLKPALWQNVPLVRKLRSYMLQARPPMPQRYASSSQLSYLGADKVFTPSFLGSVDAAHMTQLLHDAHAPYANAALVNQMMGIDLRFILTDGDLPKVTRMCELAGVDVSFPLLDDRLIEFSRHLPADLKLRGTALRWFFKRALEDFLPPAIITKQKQGFGLPVGTWLVGHQPLFDLAADSIRSLVKRDIVQAGFVDELLDTRLREHAAYFGGMAWVLMMLGLWLDSRKL